MNKLILFIITLLFISAGTTLSYHKTQKADIYYYQGHRLFEKGAYEKAIDVFQKALILKPSDNALKGAMAEAYSWIKEYEKAIQLYKEIITATGNIDTKRQLAEVYIWNKQFEEAKEILFEILKITPQDKKAKLLLARAMQYSGQAKQAIEIYKELLKKEDGNE